MKILHTTTPHYTRCIKPNPDCKPMTFEKEEVDVLHTHLILFPRTTMTTIRGHTLYIHQRNRFWWISPVCCQVIMQLEACGIVETIHISAAGFPIRWDTFLCLLSILKFVLSCVDSSFLFHRIPLKGFMQRYGLIAKYSDFKSGSLSVGEYCCL